MGGFGAKSMKEVLDVKSRINRNKNSENGLREEIIHMLKRGKKVISSKVLLLS
jgi:hypothetical protein